MPTLSLRAVLTRSHSISDRKLTENLRVSLTSGAVRGASSPSQPALPARHPVSAFPPTARAHWPPGVPGPGGAKAESTEAHIAGPMLGGDGLTERPVQVAGRSGEAPASTWAPGRLPGPWLQCGGEAERLGGCKGSFRDSATRAGPGVQARLGPQQGVRRDRDTPSEDPCKVRDRG